MAGQPKKDISEKYSMELTRVLDYIYKESTIPFNEITPEVFVIAAIEYGDTMLYKAINTYLNTEVINDIVNALYKELNKDNTTISTPLRRNTISTKLRYFFVKAKEEALHTNSELINTDHVLMAILKENNGITEAFKKFSLTYGIFMNLAKDIHSVLTDIQTETPQEDDETQASINTVTPTNIFIDGLNEIKIPTEELNKLIGVQRMIQQPQKTDKKSGIPYCTNLNQKAKNKGLGELIGREKELKEIYKIFGRKNSNNVILVGDSGVGKTEIVNGLTNAIVSGNVPITLRDKEIWKLNPTEMVAGTTLRGMFEERVVALMRALKTNKNIILFIDDLHTIISDKSKDEGDFGSLISSILSENTTQVITTTTFKGYKLICDTNRGMSQKLKKITIDQPSEDECFTILNGIKSGYEEFHGVTYSDNIIKLIIRLSKQYITDKSLPSSAVDIIDEIGSYKKLNLSIVNAIQTLNKQINEKDREITDCLKRDEIDRVHDLENEKSCMRDILAINEGKYRDRSNEEILDEDVYTTISEHTGIPMSKLKSSQKKELQNIETVLNSSVIGQEEAVKEVSRAIKRNKIGISTFKRPIGSFLFVGTSGVGKTLLAKTLAKEIFGDEKYLIRFDMSEYSDKTSINKLIGASAGYIGYSEGGLLTEAIKNNRYAVLLFDEIEKADEEIYNIFLQLLDEGFITDNTGQKVDCKNTIIILTSNIGTKKANNQRAMGFDVDQNETKRSIIEKEIKEKFPPEFINRLDNIVYFNVLTDDDIKKIVRIELEKVNSVLNGMNHSLSYDEDLVEYIFNSVRKEKEYGARPIHRMIRNEVEDKITDLIIDNDYEEHTFSVKIDNNSLKIE